MTARSGLLVSAGLLLSFALAPVAGAFDSGRTSLAVEVNGELRIPYRVFAVFVRPSERLTLKAAATAAAADAGRLVQTAPDEWQWTAPAAPGIARLDFSDERNATRLNLIVMHPAEEIAGGRLNGYRIDSYPAPLNGDPVYLPPDGLAQLTPELANLELSPHFRLGQFPAKQAGDYPKFLIVREQLLLKLELLLERLNASGVAADALTVMSGYRTPFYNHAIGNGQHSRHIYGGAADIYIDVAPPDGVMDDLNRDGRVDHRDAQWLYRLANSLFAEPGNAGLRGGLGVYRSTSAHGPFLHIDARGRPARWGLLADTPQSCRRNVSMPSVTSGGSNSADQSASGTALPW